MSIELLNDSGCLDEIVSKYIKLKIYGTEKSS